MSSTPLPAHQTKHIDNLTYNSLSHTFHLSQLSDGRFNGTALWLGAQCLSIYLAEALPNVSKFRTKTEDCKDMPPSGTASGLPKRHPRAIELGSGIGLTALTLASLGWDVLATDIASVVDSVLKPNIVRNGRLLRESEPVIKTGGITRCGNVQVRELDWSVDPSQWHWDSHKGVAVSIPENDQPRPAADENTNDHEELLGPPFDLIVTSDTVYSSELVTPLLRTLHHLCELSQRSNKSTRHSHGAGHSPLVFVAVENRDPGLLDQFFKQAREAWGFTTTRVPDRRVARAMERRRINWDREDWMDIEIWKLQLQTEPSTTSAETVQI